MIYFEATSRGDAHGYLAPTIAGDCEVSEEEVRSDFTQLLAILAPSTGI